MSKVKISDILLFLPRQINKRLRIKITYKTTFLYALLYTAIMFVIAIIIGMSVQNGIEQTAIHDAENKIAQLAVYLSNHGLSEADSVAPYLGAEIAILEGDEVVYNSGNLNPNAFGSRQSAEAVESEVMTVLRSVSIEGSPHRILWRQNISSQLENYYLLRNLFFALLPIGLVIMLALGSITSSAMLNPIKKINEFIKNVDAESLEKRLGSVNSQDELNELTRQINKMLDSLENSFFEQSRFVSDASHELRTPIAVIQGYINLLERWGKTDKNVLDEAITAISKESENMKNLVEKLLFLARTETLALKMQEFVLSELIEEIARETSLTAAGKTKKIEIVRIEPVEVCADRELVKQALRVFVDNAIKYTGENGHIKLYCYEEDGSAILRVSDNGFGIPKADLPYIFERFYRVDQARNRSIGSSGLGLSIAQWIVDAHKGNIEVTSTEGVGTSLLVRMSSISE